MSSEPCLYRRLFDRRGWPAGVYAAEPDAIVWTSRHTDERVLLLRDGGEGWWWAWVRVPPGHYLFRHIRAAGHDRVLDQFLMPSRPELALFPPLHAAALELTEGEAASTWLRVALLYDVETIDSAQFWVEHLALQVGMVRGRGSLLVVQAVATAARWWLRLLESMGVRS